MSISEAPVQREKEARKAIADWFLEVSALLAVFPWLDQIVFHPTGRHDWALTAGTTSGAIGLAFLGLSLLVDAQSVRIVLRASFLALILLAIVIFSLR